MEQQLPLITAEQANQIQVNSSFANSESFEFSQRVALALSKSDLVPAAYKNNTNVIH